MSESKDNPQLHVQLFEEDLGLPHQWFFSLMNDTDWTFVIKLSALFEGAVNHLLYHQVEKPELAKFLAALSMRGATGKLELALKLGAITAEAKRLIDELTVIRNHCVHGVKNVSFTFSDYYGGLNSAQKASLRAVFVPFIRANRRGSGLES